MTPAERALLMFLADKLYGALTLSNTEYGKNDNDLAVLGRLINAIEEEGNI